MRSSTLKNCFNQLEAVQIKEDAGARGHRVLLCMMSCGKPILPKVLNIPVNDVDPKHIREEKDSSYLL